jgi:hypothetical protein
MIHRAVAESLGLATATGTDLPAVRVRPPAARWQRLFAIAAQKTVCAIPGAPR